MITLSHKNGQKRGSRMVVEITLKDVESACRKLRKGGQKVSRRTVLDELGRGSMTTVHKLMQQLETKSEQLTGQGGIAKTVKAAAKALGQAGMQAKSLQQECAALRQQLEEMSIEREQLAEKNRALGQENRALKERIERLTRQQKEAQNDGQMGLSLF